MNNPIYENQYGNILENRTLGDETSDGMKPKEEILDKAEVESRKIDDVIPENKCNMDGTNGSKSDHSKERPFVCNFCAATFTRNYHLKRHSRIHLTDVKPYQDIQVTLSKVQSNKTQDIDIDRFIKTSQKRKKRKSVNCVSCCLCNKTHTDLVSLKSHLESHLDHHETGDFKMNNLKERTLVCDICAAAFSRIYHLNRHKKSCHSNERPFQCQVCGAKFTLDSHLKRHQMCHTNERRFMCQTCGSKFRGKSQLTEHEKIHAKERHQRFVCATCGAKFIRSSALRRHERTHLNSRPFECDTCGAKFKRDSHLTRHKRIHLNLKEKKLYVPPQVFKCLHCPYTSKRRRDRDRHMARLHSHHWTPSSSTNMGKSHFQFDVTEAGQGDCSSVIHEDHPDF